MPASSNKLLRLCWAAVLAMTLHWEQTHQRLVLNRICDNSETLSDQPHRLADTYVCLHLHVGHVLQVICSLRCEILFDKA